MPSIFDYKHFFDDYCKERSLDLHLSFDMPSDYETACGTFDPASKTVFINAAHLNAKPDYEKAFFLFHELRHASQYLCPEHFGSEIHRSLQYVIGYDGTCYKLVNGHYISCKLDGNEDYFTNLYLGQPHEVDANTFAYEQVKQLYGDSKELKALFDFWMPRHPLPAHAYNLIFSQIDKSISCISPLEKTL